jgi:3-hydroxymyristoyl/3-hydroxydecanoyl-(acyl carrier protein) dehydratase
MSHVFSVDVADVLRHARKEPLIAYADQGNEPMLDRQHVEDWLPHRTPFLFIDQVITLNLCEGLIVARYDLARADYVFSGHFPDYPVLPGVLQVEAIGQAGGILTLMRAEVICPSAITATHILEARFMRAVGPGGHLEIQARTFEDGLFATTVGQCIKDGAICSVAAIKTLC